MSTILELESCLERVRQLGYEIRYEWFGGTGGGACRLGQKKCLFLDLAQGPLDHLVVVKAMLDELPQSAPKAA